MLQRRILQESLLLPISLIGNLIERHTHDCIVEMG